MGEVSYEAARQRVVQRLRKRAFFGLHLVFFIVVCAYFNAWSNTVGLTYYSYQGYQIILFLWFGVLVGHGMFAFEVWQRMVDRMVQRELGKSAAPKRKHDLVGLGDDGELVPLVHMTDLDEDARHQHKGQ